MATKAQRTVVIADGVELSHDDVRRDYQLGWESRHASLIGRREVLSGKAKFGIFGDGKEVPQVAMAHAWRPGDFRSGYYRDQTYMFATGATTIRQYFAQLYAHTDVQADPATGGRAMNAHFGTRFLNDDGTWRDLTKLANSSADVSPTASQMPRLVGLTQASVLFRQLPELSGLTHLSHHGDEVVWGMIGDASCAEGMFWEAVNAVGIIGGPLVLSIWDDGYGISVPGRYQVVCDLSELLAGFGRSPEGGSGYNLYTVMGWDYPALIAAYHQAAASARHDHVPAIVHVKELTQPQGHSTSGSHERYKSKQRLDWELEHDSLRRMRAWMVGAGILTEAQADAIERAAYAHVEAEREAAWQAYRASLDVEVHQASVLIDGLVADGTDPAELAAIQRRLREQDAPIRRDIAQAVREALVAARRHPGAGRAALVEWKQCFKADNARRFGSHLYSVGERSPLHVLEVKPVYAAGAREVFGYEVINHAFDQVFARDPRVVAFGEDVGYLGDVNQGMRGMQDKYGALRVSDTGIREVTIVGQAIGLALRGLRPIAEVQYLDYLLYALQILSDDLATTHWRTVGGQVAPAIVRTRGHRLEGVWHSGRPWRPSSTWCAACTWWCRGTSRARPVSTTPCCRATTRPSWSRCSTPIACASGCPPTWATSPSRWVCPRCCVSARTSRWSRMARVAASPWMRPRP
jgi:TPP-dependent pyruvate/acetoin dehydrogenase alpha subunit